MMHSAFTRSIRLGVKSLLLHKLRSLLTTLGILFGVSSVIAMLAIGEGASEEAQEQIRRLGSQNVILRSVKPLEDKVSGPSYSANAYGLTWQDFERASETFPWVENSIPVKNIVQEVRFEDKVINPRILATTWEYQNVTGRIVHRGRFISQADDDLVSNVCVIGYEVSRLLFPGLESIGQKIKIGPEYFKVVGVILPRVPLSDDLPEVDTSVTSEILIPLTTGRRWFGDMTIKIRSGSREMEQVELNEIVLSARSPSHVSYIAAASREMLARNHKQNDYEIVVPLELLARAEETKRIFNIVLGCIACISLLVGGIGIMNVMLATVTERTREIGIRRALGARRYHIMLQFLVETVVLSVGGGILGILLGVSIPAFVEYFADMRTIVTFSAPILAFGISVSIGLVFGLYPAWQAANLDPVEALRHE
ncbi:MAG: ABC transporter permease [Planctomycetota bacterium]|jgi:putative ABC transport system permease protein|nr:ABC transporter permease [Planctomycetota bacterium]